MSAQHSVDPCSWAWPLPLAQYDRLPELRPLEQAALTQVVHLSTAGKAIHLELLPAALTRLRLPLHDALTLTDASRQKQREAIVLLYHEMHARQQSYWGWQPIDWQAVLQSERPLARYQRLADYRQELFVAAYLLCGYSDVSALRACNHPLLASKLFGAAAVHSALEQVYAELQRWGSSRSKAQHYLPRLVSTLLLVNRHPQLRALTLDVVAQVRERQPASFDHAMVLISRVLASLGIIAQPLSPQGPQTRAETPPQAEQGVASEWLSWCKRWRATTTFAPATRYRMYYHLLKIGRWIAETHPEAASPAMWTRELAATVVAAVDRMHVGEWVVQAPDPARQGAPLSAKGKDSLLCALRLFFSALQDWGWIARRFEPHRCLATPRSIHDLIGPNPRVIADDVWAKLLWAGMNLTAADLEPAEGPTGAAQRERRYPLALVRAVAIVWLFAGLRANEIVRLRVGCVRKQEVGVDAAAATEGDDGAIWLLDVPVNKTGTAFSKPVDRMLGEAIRAWEAERPSQPAALDAKTGELVHYLFAYRGRHLGRAYLNKHLIPLLCRKAGIPRADARGTITSHRARSTIASQLYNAKEPMSLVELQSWLGHRSPASTQHYTRLSPTRLARAYADAQYFARNLRTIEVLIDQEAIRSGAAAAGQAWKYYDLGHGYCSYDFFDQCPHRMACAKCAFYVPKASSAAQVLEAKGNLEHLLQAVPLTEEERAAVEDGVSAMAHLEEKLRNVPTPAGPTPQQLAKQEVIPLEQRANESPKSP